ncbi:MAG: tRNA lysidine(34) synthetase TilS [Verrucomicrobiota bacterium]|jgi:tRNA(Ile)-lysidine synthase
MTTPLPIPWPSTAERKKRWLIGVSGGLDSMALLHLLKEEDFRDVIVCHLDHGLRGRESTEDARFVKRWATKLGFPLETAKIDLRNEMEQSRESLETTGRIARHQFFAACAKTNRCKRLFLAHHLDDQAETVLWNLMRGSHGCRGMREQSTIKMGEVRMEVFRPLLGIRKSELQAWMEERKLKWREDASNRINDVVRNRVRNEALPLLTEIAKRDINPLLARAARADDSLREVMDWALAKAHVLDPQGRLHLGALRELPEALRLHAIAEFLRSNGAPGINGLLLESCTAMLDPTSPACVNLPGGRHLRRRAGRFFVEGN